MEKKCLVASISLHAFLLVIVVVGSAFFVSKEKRTTAELPNLRVVPQQLVEDALSGGGGNPNIAPNTGREKGQTTVPQPPVPQPPKPADPKPAPPVPKPDVKKPDLVKKPDPKPEPKVEVRKPDTAAIRKPPVKPTLKPDLTKIAQNKPPLDLVPTVRKNFDAEKARAEATAKAQAHETEMANRRTSKNFDKAIEGLKSGFASGTVVEASGPGGLAYANYAQFVREVYESEWVMPPDLLDEDATAKVTVTISRDGRVISSRIERRSGNSTLDKSVQRVLNTVKFVHKFPEDARDEQRTFTINFNLKAKRAIG